jgi:hypothetical protein
MSMQQLPARNLDGLAAHPGNIDAQPSKEHDRVLSASGHDKFGFGHSC